MTLWAVNLILLSVQITIVVACGALLIRHTPLRAPGPAHAFWRMVLLLSLLLPLFVFRSQPDSDGGGTVVSAMGAATPLPAAIPWDRWLILVVAAGCLLFLLRLALSLWRIRTCLRRSRPLPSDGGEAEFRVSEDVKGPVTFGWPKPVILVPPSYLVMAPAAQQAIRNHELVHVRRHDWFHMLAEEVVRAIYWFHPAVWYVLGRIHVTREQVVDLEAIGLTGDRDSYLDALLSVAGLRREPDYSPAPLFLRRRHLAERVETIVRQPRAAPGWAKAAGIAVLGAAAAVALTIAPLRPPPKPVDRIRVGGNQQAGKLVQRPRPLYPLAAKQARIQGTVRMAVIIGRDGRVKSVEPVAGHPLLTASAVEAVRQWQYQPTWLNGQPVEVATRVDVNFTLTK